MLEESYKIKKINREIDKIKEKIVEYQEKLKELQNRKIEQENLEIIKLVRTASLKPEEVALFLSEIKNDKDKENQQSVQEMKTENTDEEEI